MKTMGFVAGEALQQVHRKINDASAAQAATIYGILFDKQRIMMDNLSGSSAGNTFIINGMSGDDTMQLLQRVLERQKQQQVIDIDAQVLESEQPEKGQDGTGEQFGTVPDDPAGTDVPGQETRSGSGDG